MKNENHQVANPRLRKIVHSKYLDIIAVAIILTVSFVKGFHETFFYKWEAQFNIPFDQWAGIVSDGGFPLGLFSIIVACFSMLSTRFIAKQDNLGNFIGIGTTVCVCLIDYALGNKSAIITYPITFFISIFATIKWKNGEKVKQKDYKYYALFVIGGLVGYLFTWLGFHLFSEAGWYEIEKIKWLFHTIAITFSISLAANLASAFKYQDTWVNWLIYNIVQLVKNTIQQNYANVGKYIFYIFNAVITYFDWKINKDSKKIES